MSIEIKAPQFPESVADGTVATWHKKLGELVKRDELIVDIETDKVVLEVVAPADGKITKVFYEEGDTIESQAILAEFETGVVEEAPAKTVDKVVPVHNDNHHEESSATHLSPAVRKLVEENNLDSSQIIP